MLKNTETENQDARQAKWVTALIKRFDVFDHIDKSNNGNLSFDEFKTMQGELNQLTSKITKKEKTTLPDDVLTKFFAKIDSDHDGKLSFDELLEVLRKHPAYSMCETEETFQELMEWFEQNWTGEKRRDQNQREADRLERDELIEEYGFLPSMTLKEMHNGVSVINYYAR